MWRRTTVAMQKAVNFGVVYGISDFGLSNNLGISRKEAKAYIETYFERYPGIKDYMERSGTGSAWQRLCRNSLQASSEIPDINSRNFNVRGFAERTAINSPIQGSAADILKIAMIHLDQALEAGVYKTKMLPSGPRWNCSASTKWWTGSDQRTRQRDHGIRYRTCSTTGSRWKRRQDMVWSQIKLSLFKTESGRRLFSFLPLLMTNTCNAFRIVILFKERKRIQRRFLWLIHFAILVMALSNIT